MNMNNTEPSTVQWLRSFRVFGIAFFDLVTSYVGAAIIGWFLGFRDIITWTLFLILWTLIGIVTHVFMKQPTMLSYYLGLSAKPNSQV